MLERFQSKKSDHSIQYCVFDIIYFQGKKVSLPLIARKELLEDVVKQTDKVVKVQWMHGNGEAYFDLVEKNSLEGIVLKKASSKYSVGSRSRDWLKVINYQYADVYITALRKKQFGLLLAIERDGKLKPGGVMEFIGPDARKEFYSKYRDYIVEEDKRFVFLDPKIKCRVKFRNYTKSGLLRIPSFVEYIS